MKCSQLCLALLAAVGLVLPSSRPGANQVQARDGSWTGSRDAMVGETVLCRSLLTMPESGEGTYTCRLSPGLRFDAVKSVTCGGERVNAAFYTVVTARQEDAAFTLHLSPMAAAPGEILTVEYSLRLWESAGAENRFSLAPAGEEGPAGCIRTLSLTVLRAVLLGPSGPVNPLSDACLCLSTDPAGRERVAFRSQGEDRYQACCNQDCPHSRHLYVMKTPGSGRIYLEGLSAGTYYLSETRPVQGEQDTAESVEILLTETGEIWANGKRCPDGTVALTHTVGESRSEPGRFSLTEFYRRGSEFLAMALLALIAARRYYL